VAKIYLSSTYRDLIMHREAVSHVLHRMRHNVIAMEDYVAADERPLDVCLRDVAACDIYIGIFAWRYGFIPLDGNPDRKSITELEYLKAYDLGKPRLIFLLADNGVAWLLEETDSHTGEGESGKCIAELRKKLELERLVSPFHTPDELATLVSAAVTNYEKSLTHDTTRIALLTRCQYLDAVYEHYKSVKLPIGPASGISLLAIFQPLKLRSDPLAAEDLEREKRRKLLGEDLSQDEERFLRTSLTSGSVDNAQEALARSPQKRIVVLGGPGTGKSTTLKHLVASAAEVALAAPDDTNLPLPIFISLPDLARVSTGLQSYLPHIVDELKIDSAFANDLWQAINTGRAFICLDSLDEVAPRLRGDIIERINTWTADTRNTWIVGSRFTEYKGGQFRRGQFSEWELQVMDVPMRRTLAQRLLPRLQEHFVTAHSIAATPTTFVKLIEKHPQAAAWGENPLLFSLAAIVFIKTGTLPSSRTSLYREIIEAVLRVSERDPSECELLLRDFTSLALWLHEKKGRTFTRRDLVTFLQDVQQLPRGDIASITNRIVASGLMEVVAHETFGFRHQTFQEYLAAVELGRRFASSDASVKKEAWDYAWSKRTYSRWIEILRLLVGVLAQQLGSEGERLVQRWLCTLVEQRETLEGDPGDLGLLLALKSLSEVAGQGDMITIETEKIAEKIVLIWIEELLNIARNHRRSYARQYRFSELAYEISHLRECLRNIVSGSLVMALSHHDARVRMIAVQLLGEQGESVPLRELEAMLMDDIGYVREAAVRALGEQGERVPIEELRGMLEDKNGDVRAAAVQVLGRQGERVPIEELRGMLEDNDGDVRAAAVQVLGRQGEKVSIEELKRMLKDKKWNVRAATVRTLGEQGERVPIEELRRMLDDKIWIVREAAVRALGEQGERVPIEELRGMLEDKNGDVRAAAVRALGEQGERVPVEELRGILEDREGNVWVVAVEVLEKRGERVPLEELGRMLYEDGNVREVAVQVLGNLEEGVPIEELRRMLDDNDGDVRATVVRVLGRQRERVPIEELRRMLEDRDGDVRAAAVWAMEERKGRVLIKELRRMLEDRDEDVRFAAVWGLGELREKVTIKELRRMLEDRDGDVRAAAIQVLRRQKGRVPIGKLRRMLEDRDGDVRAAAIQVLRRQKGRVPIGKLRRMLEDRDGGVRMIAVQILGKQKGKIPIRKLRRMLEDKDGGVRAEVIRVLSGKMGGMTIEELMKMLEDKESNVRVAAVRVLGNKEGKVPIEELMKMLEDKESNVREAAVRVLGNKEGKVPIEELMKMLEDKESNVREAAVRVLGNEEGKVPIEELMKMLEDKESNVREAAVRVLGNKEGKVPIEELMKMLEDKRYYVRVVAIEMLGRQGERVPIEGLRKMLKDGDNDVRRTAIQALGKRKKPMYMELTPIMGDEDNSVRHAVLNMLKHDPEAFSLVTSESLAIVRGEHTGEILGSIQKYLVIRAVRDLAKVFPKLLDMLTPLLDWPYWLVRLRTVEALGQIQRNIPDAAIKRLLELRLDPDPDMRLIREAADDALAEILSLDGIEDD
jgi:HEAT repeat protein